jgi:hypothetical protein
MKYGLNKSLGLIPFVIILLGLNASLAFGAVPEAVSGKGSAILTIKDSQIATGDAVKFSIFIADSSTVPKPEIKPIDGLDIKYLGPITQFQYINGRSSSKIIHEYLLTALKPGTYTLGPFEIMDGKNKLITNTVQLTVNEGSSDGGSDKSDNLGQSDSQLYFNFSVPETKMCLGEKVTITFRLYVGDVRLGGNIESLSFNQPQVTLDQMKVSREQQELINGQQYHVVEITGILSPLKTGVFTLGPAKLVLPVMVRQRSDSDGFGDLDDFFSDYVKQEVQLESTNKLTITVLPAFDQTGSDSFPNSI